MQGENEAEAMDTLPVKPERMEALEKYAHQLGKEPAEVLDDALAKFLDYETCLPALSKKEEALRTGAS